MFDPLVEGSPFGTLFNQIISLDEIKQYKPTPASYSYALDVLNFSREEVLFM